MIAPASPEYNDVYAAGIAGLNVRQANTVFDHNLDDGQWHLSTLSYDGSTSRLYLDGVMINERLINVEIPNGTNPMFISGGGSGSPMPVYIFNGLLDDVRIYNRALSTSEIQELYTGEQSCTEEVGTVSSNLDIHIPSLNYQSLLGTQNIWVELEYSHEENGKLYWSLEDYGAN